MGDSLESTKKKFSVVDAFGNTSTVDATHAESDGTSVTFFDGENVVAAFRGFNSFAPVS